MIDESPHVHKLCTYVDDMEDDPDLEGFADKTGLFDIVYAPFLETKKVLRYPHNGKDKLELELR